MHKFVKLNDNIENLYYYLDSTENMHYNINRVKTNGIKKTP